MRTIWLSLVWKEWHEHKWRFASLAAIVCTVLLVSLKGDNGPDLFGVPLMMTMMAICPLALFVGAGSAAGERSRATLPFLQSLPVPTWRVALHKLAFGLLTVNLPLLGLTAVMVAWSARLSAQGKPFVAPMINGVSPPNSPFNEYWPLLWACLLCTLASSVYLWTCAAGARRGDEISAGAFGLLAMVGWWIVLILATLGFAYFFWDDRRPSVGLERLGILIFATAPGGFMASLSPRSFGLLPATAVMTALTLCGLAVAYVRRFGAIQHLGERSPPPASRRRHRRDWLTTPFAHPGTAIAWKQFRESGPLAMAGLAGILAIAAVLSVDVWRLDSADRIAAGLVDIYAVAARGIGLFLALMAGVGVALSDSHAAINTFWRSRPINPNQWFWGKYVAGLLVLLACLYLPMLIVASLLHPGGVGSLWVDEAILWPPLHLALFASGVAVTCLVRQALYAAVLSIGAIYLGLLPAALIWGDNLKAGVAAVALLIVAAVMTVLGWLAMRFDWGWQGPGRR